MDGQPVTTSTFQENSKYQQVKTEDRSPYPQLPGLLRNLPSGPLWHNLLHLIGQNFVSWPLPSVTELEMLSGSHWISIGYMFFVKSGGLFFIEGGEWCWRAKNNLYRSQRGAERFPAYPGSAVCWTMSFCCWVFCCMDQWVGQSPGCGPLLIWDFFCVEQTSVYSKTRGYWRDSEAVYASETKIQTQK